MKKISICIPVLNEEENIKNICNYITDLFEKNLKNYDYEIIFTDNNSFDKTEEIILSFAKTNKKIKYIKFKNNLLYDKSILEAYKHASGDAAIVLDADFQDPPNLIKDFIFYWEQGYDLVYGIRTKRKESNIFNFMRKMYYKIINLNSAISYPLDAGGFRLIDRKIIERLNLIKNLYPYVRGLTFSFSLKPYGIEYVRNSRKKGKSKLGIYNTFTYALNALFEETIFFTKIIRKISLFSFILAFCFSAINILLIFKLLPLIYNLILISLVLIFFGVSLILEYVTRIYFHLKQEEVEIYEKKINF
jgi:glycosyltransferase involved in cell wall biosynthesis